MSVSNQAQLPDLQTATSTIMHNVHRRAFLAKLAECGIRPEGTYEENAALELGFKLAAADPAIAQPDPFQLPQQSTRMGKIASALSGLDEVLGTKVASDRSEEAAVMLASDPEIYNAALAIKVAEAQALQEQQG